MKEYLEKVIKETNRVMFKWMALHKEDQRFKITQADVKSVFNSWFTRVLKSEIGYSETATLLRYARPTIMIDAGCQITGVSLCVISEYRIGGKASYQTIALILSQIDYNSLRFKEEDQAILKREQEHRANLALGVFSPEVNIDFSKLQNIHFI